MAAPRPNGNTRTSQASNFHLVDCTKATRHRLDTAQATAEAAELQAASPLDGGMDMTNLSERWGRAIQVSQFISLLRRLNPSFIFELSRNYPEKYGIYISRRKTDASRLVYYEKQFVTGMISGLEFGGIGSGYMPEFSIIVSSEIQVPDRADSDRDPGYRYVRKFNREIRGWRTVLAALILERLVTVDQIERVFHISAGKDSANWQKRVVRSQTTSTI